MNISKKRVRTLCEKVGMEYVRGGKIKAVHWKGRYGLHLDWNIIMAISKHGNLDVQIIEHDINKTFQRIEMLMDVRLTEQSGYKEYLIKHNLESSVTTWLEYMASKMIQ